MQGFIGLAEVVLNVRDLPKMRQFYMDVLGFTLISESNFEDPPIPDGIPTITFLQLQPIDTPLGRNGHPLIFALIDPLRHAFTKGKYAAPEIRTSTLNHLAFEISSDSHDFHLNRLTELGLSPTVSEFPHMQAKAIFFRDPEDNTLELICRHKSQE